MKDLNMALINVCVMSCKTQLCHVKDFINMRLYYISAPFSMTPNDCML